MVTVVVVLQFLSHHVPLSSPIWHLCYPLLIIFFYFFRYQADIQQKDEDFASEFVKEQEELLSDCNVHVSKVRLCLSCFYVS